MRDPVAEFKEYNRSLARRNPELLRYKVARMAEGPFAFYRGTFHLFARDLLEGPALPSPIGSGPELELVGDIHSENYGTFQAEGGNVHYDVNDFDETTSGRFGLDICRLATSHFLATQDRAAKTLEQAVQLTLAGLRSYVEAVRRLLKKGKDLHLDVSEVQPSGAGAVDGLVEAMAIAKRTAFIGKLTEWDGRQRRLVRTANYFNLPAAESEQALRLLADYRQRVDKGDAKEDFYKVEDVCGRVSGIGSMGRLRYVLLLAGKGSAEGRNVLLEFKEALPSAYDVYRNRVPPADTLTQRAERVVTVQKQSQAASDPYAGWAVDGGQSFQARQRGPRDERLKFSKLSAAEVEGAVRVQAAILARVHARSAMRAVGPTNPLAELEDEDAFCQRGLAFALGYADQVRRDWQRFVGARAELDHVEGWAGPSNNIR
jgi:uncharacterized protein (DUF2252 family)